MNYRGNYRFSVVSMLLCKSANSQDLCCFKERRQRSLMNVDFAVVYKFNEGVQICPGHILQYYHRVFARC